MSQLTAAAYWVTPAMGKPFTAFCIEAQPDAVERKVVSLLVDPANDMFVVWDLPYPASPIKGERLTSIPPFCFKPETCKGHTSCPRNQCCTN